MGRGCEVQKKLSSGLIKCLQGVPERGSRVWRSPGDLDISNNAGSAVLRRCVHSATVARSPVLSVSQLVSECRAGVLLQCSETVDYLSAVR